MFHTVNDPLVPPEIGAAVPPILDLLHSAFFFRTTSTFDHTPRMQLAAACRLEREGQEPVAAYVTHPCIAESMYKASGLIQEPVATFTAIVIAGAEVAFLRRTAVAGDETRSSIRLGAQMPTHSGIPATMLELRVLVRDARDPRALADGAAIRAAAMDGSRIVGRTSFTLDGGTITLDYPVTTINVSNDSDAWQVDAGPVLLPTRTPGDSGFAVDRFEPGYLVFNQPDWAEITSLGGDGEARPVRVSTRTELFAIG
ncbi:MAG: hypothetical protein U0869_23755 [Chloroflexota bacterium]